MLKTKCAKCGARYDYEQAEAGTSVKCGSLREGGGGTGATGDQARGESGRGS